MIYGIIPFRLRIGVTGHRHLTEPGELREAVSEAIADAAVQSGYSADQRPSTPLRLTVVSALAEGADRLVAQEVLKRPGSRLVCVLPVPRKELPVYLADFKSDKSREEFLRLYNGAWRQIFPRADTLQWENTPAGRNAGYLWAGQEVIRNSDVVIALWDGQPPRGEGGTADLIHRMRQRDMMIAGAQGPPLVFDIAGPLRIIVPANGRHRPEVDADPPFDAAARIARNQLTSDLDGLDRLNRTKFAAAEWEQAVTRTADDLASAEYRAWPRLNGLIEWITPPLARADQAAMAAHRWYLASSYALFSCTAAATVIAALQAIVFPGIWELTIGELVLLAATVAIVAAEKRWKNHERWFAYRFLAERLRSAYYLMAAGVIPETSFDFGGPPGDAARGGWIRRAYTAVLAEQDTAHGKHPEPPETLSSLIRAHWVAGQIAYFENASRRNMRNHQTVRGVLYTVLGITIAAGAVHSMRVWPFQSDPTEVLVMCAIGLPAVAGALSNLRSLREFRKHSLRYARMADVLRWHLNRFEDESGVHGLRRLALSIDDVLAVEARGWLGVVAEQELEIHG